ncbi:MAG TPA: hypothetical protein VKP65_20045 [Rhodothermales bacterium]|nr:hypothetical protein [Rhodothermales bacterium]
MNRPDTIPQNPFWFLEDDEILRRIVLKYEKLLTEDDVIDLLGISRPTLRKWIKEGSWYMTKFPDDRRRMTIKQFREQINLIGRTNGR